MNQAKIEKIRLITAYMGITFWQNKSCELSSFDKEMNEYTEELLLALRALAVSGFEIAEKKYQAYLELIENADSENPKSYDLILEENKRIIQETDEKRKGLEYKVSEIIFMLNDLKERLIVCGNLPQNVPAAQTQGISQKEEKGTICT